MRAPALIIIASLCAVLLTGTGCTSDDIVFVDEGTSYTADSAIELLEASDSGRLARASASDADHLRQEALSALRQRAGAGAVAARTITRTFPGASGSVPYRVERASFDGTECWMILEASGRAGGRLEDRRLWVIDTDGGVLLFASR